jgi:hypothetical protein
MVMGIYYVRKRPVGIVERMFNRSNVGCIDDGGEFRI